MGFVFIGVETFIEVMGYESGHGQRVEMDQLMVAACVRLQLENTKDELRGMTQMCTARSDERPERSCHTTWPKLMNFPAKFHFHKKPGGRNGNTDRQFVTFLRA